MLLHFIVIFIGTDFDLCLCHSLTYCCPVRLLEANRAAEELVDVVADVFLRLREIYINRCSR